LEQPDRICEPGGRVLDSLRRAESDHQAEADVTIVFAIAADE